MLSPFPTDKLIAPQRAAWCQTNAAVIFYAPVLQGQCAQQFWICNAIHNCLFSFCLLLLSSVFGLHDHVQMLRCLLLIQSNARTQQTMTGDSLVQGSHDPIPYSFVWLYYNYHRSSIPARLQNVGGEVTHGQPSSRKH